MMLNLTKNSAIAFSMAGIKEPWWCDDIGNNWKEHHIISLTINHNKDMGTILAFIIGPFACRFLHQTNEQARETLAGDQS